MDRQKKQFLQLPSLPTVAVRLLSMFSEPDVGLTEVISVLQTDPALSGRILRAANSSRSGLKQPVSDLRRAVIVLGKNSVTALALGFSLSEASMNTGKFSHLYSDFWFQSLVRGFSASLLADRYTLIDRGEAFTVGLLSRIGRLAVLNSSPEQFVVMMKNSEKSGQPLDLTREPTTGLTPRDITQHLLREWKLPRHCLNAIADVHSSVDDACEACTKGDLTLTNLLRIASSFGDFFSGENSGMAIARLYELGSEILNEDQVAINGMVESIRRELDDHSDLFSVDMSKVGTPLELIFEAMAQLSQIVAQSAVLDDEPRGVPVEMLEENGRLRKRVLELTQSAMTDTLTGLFNRQYLIQQLEERTQLARSASSAVAMLFLDLDGFKKLNDRYGHLAGDEVLRSVAKSLKDSVRERDVVTRYGGEEFVILTTAMDHSGLARQAERIRRTIENTGIIFGDHTLRVTASIGGSLGIPGRDDDRFAERLLEAADSAMYRSKREGRNRVTITDECSHVLVQPATCGTSLSLS